MLRSQDVGIRDNRRGGMGCGKEDRLERLRGETQLLGALGRWGERAANSQILSHVSVLCWAVELAWQCLPGVL